MSPQPLEPYDRPRIIDLNAIFYIIVAVVEAQYRLLARAGWEKPFHAKFRLLNVWRTIPFLDVDEVVDRFEADGIPACLDGEVTSPPGADPETFIEVPAYTDREPEFRFIRQALDMFAFVARPWGIATNEGIALSPDYISQLYEAGQKAVAMSGDKLAG